ncbi:C-C motif chemokine 5-like [Erpetoichthys calabaricus]|uniref:C-C motif chemokine n=1 Tax=Erpetoichthys calabaricus TaxID=27687 RepID=A0A8C4SLV9_ERPCA|nr:C-C motif chemokine 5-like [Erpetoichthys calabaricus]
MSSRHLLVLVGTLVVLGIVSLSEGFNIANSPKKCCFEFITKPIPRGRLTGYYTTSSQCPNQAVLFTTRKNREICANPEEMWVLKYMKYFDGLSRKTSIRF